MRTGHWEIFRFTVGRAPQGLAISPDGQRLYVNNFMDRTVGVFDLSRLMNLGESNVPAIATLPAVATETLTRAGAARQAVLLRRARHAARARCVHELRLLPQRRRRVTAARGTSPAWAKACATPISLRGRSGAQGFLHWSANFDEVQDFEGQIRAPRRRHGPDDATRHSTPARAASRSAIRRRA